MSPRFVLRRENVPCVAQVVNRSLKADCTDFKCLKFEAVWGVLNWSNDLNLNKEI